MLILISVLKVGLHSFSRNRFLNLFLKRAEEFGKLPVRCLLGSLFYSVKALKHYLKQSS